MIEALNAARIGQPIFEVGRGDGADAILPKRRQQCADSLDEVVLLGSGCFRSTQVIRGEVEVILPLDPHPPVVLILADIDLHHVIGDRVAPEELDRVIEGLNELIAS